MLSEYQQNTPYKTLIVEFQSNQKTVVVTTEIYFFGHYLNLLEPLSQIIDDLPSRTLKVYNFTQDRYKRIDSSTCLVTTDFVNRFHSHLLLLKVDGDDHCSLSEIQSQEGEIKSESSSLKKERSKERVIFQVIDIVKKWRQIHMNKNNYKKVSLQEAAKMVGLPKKSLDDYYYQLRLGEKYEFDFKTHLFQRIGVLRTYLKNLKDSSRYDKNQKHPKKLKILEQFDTLSQFYRNTRQMQEQSQKQQERQIQMNDEENKSIHDQFQNEFQFLLNERDPFLSYDYDFKKKTYDEDQNDLFF